VAMRSLLLMGSDHRRRLGDRTWGGVILRTFDNIITFPG